MSLSTTMPNKDSSYPTPVYNTPKPKQLRSSSSRKTTTPETEDKQYIMQQWNELMQKIQRERQEITKRSRRKANTSRQTISHSRNQKANGSSSRSKR